VVVFLICIIVYIFKAKKKRQKKKIARLKEEMRSKRDSAVQNEKLLEMGKMLHAQHSEVNSSLSRSSSGGGSGGGLSDDERARRKAKRKAEKEKVRAALDDGLPPGWRSFTDKSTGGVYYCHMETGETTWTRPVMETIIEKEVPATSNPMRSDVEEQNEILKEQMRKLVENNRKLKKEAHNSSKVSNAATLHTIDSAKRKKALGHFKKAVAGVTMQSRESTPASKMAAAVQAAKAQADIEGAEAQFPAPPPGGAAAAAAGKAASARNIPSIGLPPPGPRPGESARKLEEGVRKSNEGGTE
jgi:hypothetical protein